MTWFPHLFLLALSCSLWLLLPRTSLAQNTTTTTTTTTTTEDAAAAADCYSNTTLLLQALEVTTSTRSGPQTFRLCANTVFPITDLALLAEDDDADDASSSSRTMTTTTSGRKMAPLFLKSYVTIQCGNDGASTNNCTLQGGQTQVVNLPTIFGGSASSASSSSAGSSTNTVQAVVRGVTFANATEMAALLANAGDVTFVDCVFRDHINLGAVTMAWSPTLGLPSTTPEKDDDNNNDDGVNKTVHQYPPDTDNNIMDDSVLQVVDNVNQFANQFDRNNSSNNNSNRNRNRELTHISFAGISLPEECTTLNFEHDFASVPAVLKDWIQCTDYCGPGQYVNLTLTTICTTLDEEGCENTVDCKVAGCNEDCDAEAGECDCTDKFGQAEDGSLTVTGLCEEVCAAEPVDVVTPAPTLSPTSAPVPVPVPVPATSSPTSAPVTGVEDPTDDPTPPSTSSNRQRVTFQKCSFLSNKPLPTQTGPRAVVVVDTAFSDLVMEDCYFANNDFSQVSDDTLATTLVENFDSYGAAVLVEAGSTLQITGTCFSFNDFSGPGTVIVAGDPDPLLYEGVTLNNFGTDDDGLTCSFLALVSSLDQSPSTCVEYDAAECSIAPSSGATTTTTPVAENTSNPAVSETTEPTTSPVETPAVSPTSSPPTTTTPESPVDEEEESFVCHVCPDGEEMTLPQALVVIPAGFVTDSESFVTCELLEESIAMNSEQVVDLCADIHQNFARPCGCSPIDADDGDNDNEEEEDSTPPATESTSPSVSESPDGEEENPFVCHICPDDEKITLPQATIVIPAGFISDMQSFVTCDLMERSITLNSEQVADFCKLIQQNYAAPCGCLPIEDGVDGEEGSDSDEDDLADEAASSDLTRRRLLLSSFVALVVLLLC